MKNIIILTNGESQEAWGSLTELCRAHEWSYNYLKRQKLPFKYKGWKINRVPFKQLNKLNHEH